VKRLAAAVMFLTRLPVPGEWEFGAADVGRSMVFFPLVGAAIGAIQCGLLFSVVQAFRWWEQHTGTHHSIPATLVAVMAVALGALVTGALHLDGLADMADGFGGGRSKDDVLRIMRDHAIGAYGAVALLLLLGIKIASISFLIERGSAYRFLVVAPALARGSSVLLAYILPYARTDASGTGGAAQHVNGLEVLFSSAFAVTIAAAIGGWRGVAMLAVVGIASSWSAYVCNRKIQGVTGDTLGANVEICETLALAAGAFLVA
jgi:adenosylcobinamide-GDP ribazoletransferase